MCYYTDRHSPAGSAYPSTSNHGVVRSGSASESSGRSSQRPQSQSHASYPQYQGQVPVVTTQQQPQVCMHTILLYTTLFCRSWKLPYFIIFLPYHAGINSTNITPNLYLIRWWYVVIPMYTTRCPPQSLAEGASPRELCRASQSTVY